MVDSRGKWADSGGWTVVYAVHWVEGLRICSGGTGMVGSEGALKGI